MPTTGKAWSVTRDGKDVLGPFSPAELREMAGRGELKATYKVWKEGLSGWVEAQWLTGLFHKPKAAKTGQSRKTDTQVADQPKPVPVVANGKEQTPHPVIPPSQTPDVQISPTVGPVDQDVIRLTCPDCGKRVYVDRGLSGQIIACPICHEQFQIPGAESIAPSPTATRTAASPPTQAAASSSPPTQAAAPSSPHFTGQPPLVVTTVPCAACQHLIATTASTCPQCGAPNTWVHPEIKRFRDNCNTVSAPQSFEFVSTSTILRGYTQVKVTTETSMEKAIKVGTISVISIMLGALTPLSGLIVPIASIVLFFSFEAMLIASLDKTPLPPPITLPEFTLDFSQTPPRWSSNDEEFWKGVKGFFRLA
jgi:GYF domain 2